MVYVQVPALRCGKCEQIHYRGEDLARAELAVADRILRTGLGAGGAFKFVRKALGYRATDLSQMLGVRPETISRWENDRPKDAEIDRSAWVTLAGLVSDALRGRDDTKQLLGALVEPKRPKEPLNLDLASYAAG